MPFPTVRLIEDGQPVDASAANVPHFDLIARTDFLKQQLDRVQTSLQSIRVTNQPVGDSVTEDKLVHFDQAISKWNLALAEIIPVGIPPRFEASDRTHCAGIAKNVIGTAPNKTADIYLEGIVPSVSPFNLLQTSDVFAKGEILHLSVLPTQIGRATNQRPSGADVLIGEFVSDEINGLATLRLNIEYKDLGEGHLHYRFELDQAAFIPLGPSEFLYPASLLDPFPPIPFESAYLEVNGISYLYGLTEDFFIDFDGLHVISTDFPLPTVDPVNIQLYYIQIASESSPGVTSLFSGTDNVELRNCSPGGPAHIGDLKISVFNIFDTIDTNFLSGQSIKFLSTDVNNGHTLVRMGPAVERVVAGRNVSISPQAGSGIVTINAFVGSVIEDEVNDIALENAKESLRGQTTYVEFLKTSPTAILGKFHVPEGIDPSADLEFLIFHLAEASVGGTADFSLSVINLKDGTSLDQSAVTKTVQLVYPNTYSQFTVLKTTLSVVSQATLQPNSLLSFRLSRKLDTDSLNTSVGILQLRRRLKML